MHVVSGRHLITETIKRAVFQADDWLFERLRGLDLGGVIPREKLSFGNGRSQAHASAYHAVWCRNIRVLLREAGTKAGSRFDYFADIGAGKGKACIYAHGSKAFPHILGIEYSADLLRTAEANRRKVGADNVSFVHADATEYVLPDGRGFVFMFNPFDAVVLERFLENNLQQFAASGSIIAYANDVHRASLAKYGFATYFRDKQRAISLHSLP
jgi:precorrin-6B methylase 2